MLLGRVSDGTVLSCSRGFHRALYHLVVRVDRGLARFEEWAPMVLLACRTAAINLGNESIGFRLCHCLSLGFEGVSEVLHGT